MTKEEKRIKCKEWRLKHPDYFKKWRILHPNYLKEWHLKHKGYSAKYFKEWREKNREIIRLCKKRYNANKKRIDKITIQTIQRVYEDNIKQYNTLTCYLCLKSIEFGQDCLEHKTPLSRGGTNKYSNLAIAHRSCNSRKRSRMEEEFRKYMSYL